ncbi:MAG: hypothetical protein JW891_12170 [Candidatus Lokiarchaeota archaeon]|nr:hypothetical protein [Candidatus Lokiarchaeota archaeon]
MVIKEKSVKGIAILLYNTTAFAIAIAGAFATMASANGLLASSSNRVVLLFEIIIL